MTHPAHLGAFIGSYRLADFLGAGGMGEVYRAVDTRTGHVVAVKILLPSALGSTVLERFRNEATLQSKLSHPGIARLYEFVEFGDRPCIVMEYVDGQTLADRIRSRGGLPVGESLAVLHEVAAAVGYVHAQGIVHRDLKPTNIRVTSTGVIKLLDFGIAKSQESPGLTRTGSVIGTPLYLAPERFKAGESTPQSDIWSLGILLYEMLAGKVPFEAATITELWELVKKGEYLRASALPRVSGGDQPGRLRKVDRIIARCLKTDPAGRYRSTDELLRDLDQVVRAEPEVAGIRPREAPSASPVGSDLVQRGVRITGHLLGGLERWWAVLVGSAVTVVLLVIVVLAWRSPPPSPGPAVPVSTTRSVRPSSQPTELSVDVVEGSAEVYINGELKGRTPYVYQTRFGDTLTLEVRQPGFEPLKMTFTVGQQKTLTLNMRRSPSTQEPP